MNINMNKEELRRFLLHAPQESIVKHMETIHPVDVLDILRGNQGDSFDILNRLTKKTIAAIIDEEESNKLLSKMTVADARNVRQLLSYAPDTAAGIMATEFISIRENMTVKETLKYLQSTKDDIENIYDLYVIDNFERVKGSISLKDIVIYAK